VLGDVVAHDDTLEGVERQESRVADEEQGAGAGQAERGVQSLPRRGVLDAQEELRRGEAVLLGDEGGGERDAGEVVEEGVGEGGRVSDGGGSYHTDTVL